MAKMGETTPVILLILTVVGLFTAPAAGIESWEATMTAKETEEGHVNPDCPLMLLAKQEVEERFSSMLRGSGGASGSADESEAISMMTNGETKKETTQGGGGDDSGVELPPIPPIHPHHNGSVQYTSRMNADGTTTYRRDIKAPCDYGMLLFNVGPALDELPYEYDIYGDVYLWSDNLGLCVLYPTYDGYQESDDGPFWHLGYDPMTVNFGDLNPNVSHMHRISSRIGVPPGARNKSKTIDRERAGDYIIMAHHDFYSIDYYKVLKKYVNGWNSTTSIATGIANDK